MMPNWQLEVFDGNEAKTEVYGRVQAQGVKLTQQPGRSVSAVARELGVERSVLKGWVDNFAAGRYEKDRALPLKAAQQLENEQLRRVGESSNGARHSKKALGYFAKEPT
ncbi:MAG: transposase [Betaproteobacteria bacterium]|nr:transposase [Betaproteobacteria bacterium]